MSVRVFALLEICKASARKSLQGIDYFITKAGEAFDGIGKMIENTEAFHRYSKRLIENLKRTVLFET